MAGKKFFLFIEMPGGRYKAVFKLQASLSEATKIAAKELDLYQVGSWVTARFTTGKPMPGRLWPDRDPNS